MGVYGPLRAAPGARPSRVEAPCAPERAGICPDFPCHLQFSGREKDQKLTLQKRQRPGGALADCSLNADLRLPA